MNRCLALTITLVLGTIQSSGAAGEPAKNYGFQVPEGFEVSLYADDSLATDIHSLTIDSHGRVVVASKGYIKILHDTKGVGKADKATLFADFPKSGAHGMYFDGDDLICNGDKGVRRLYDTKGVGRCDKVSEHWFPTKNDGEHAANGIVRGPDGWYYMITGNDAGMTANLLTSTVETTDILSTSRSPVKEPNSGVVLRFSPEGQKREIIAHGFRNPYDLAFNQFGQLFTVDADGERVYHMPYYAPTRLFDITQGMHHGWITSGWMRSWSRPPIWPDNVERMVEIGRGSPTGLIVYRHRAFPEKYRGGVFSLCWTFGRLYFMPLNRNGSSYDSKMEVFMRTTGDVGFAPTDMAVGPDGDLFIAIGGRGTRGSVFRVHFKGPSREPIGKDDALKAVLAADEPLASWSRARWVPTAKKLGKEVFRAAVLDAKLPVQERIRAVEVLTELFGGVTADLAQNVCTGKHDPELIARTIWSLSRRLDDSLAARQVLVAQTSAADPRVARAAWEAIEYLSSALGASSHAPDWDAAFSSTDRRVRRAAVLVAKGKGSECFAKFRADRATLASRAALAALWVDGPPAGKNAAYWKTCSDVVIHAGNLDMRLEAVRLLQIALGDVDSADGSDRAFAGYASDKAFVGYVSRLAGKLDPQFRQNLAGELTKGFPAKPVFDANYPQVDLELARLLAMLEADVPGLPDRLTNRFTKDSSVEQDIHYLLCLARLPGKRSSEAPRKTASALNGIHIKLAKRGEVPSDFTPTILEAILERLVLLDPALPAALVADPTFGIPGHSLFANKLPEDAKQAAARKLLAALGKLDVDQARAAWNADLVKLVASLPDEEALPILRAHFAEPRVADSIALLLAQKRRPEDRGRWLDALVSTQPAVVSAAAEALLSLKEGPAKVEPLDSGKVVRSLRRLETQKGDVKIQQTLISLLEKWNGKLLAPTETKDTPATLYLVWFTKNHPKEAAALPGLVSADFATWKKRLDKIAWDDGDQRRGEVVFQRKNCYRCHGESRRLGPDLTGAAQRFSREDLFVAIFDPSKDVAPSFKPISVATRSGKVHNGMIIYESQQLVLLQTGPDTTVRIPGEEVESIQPSSVSFMPAGLLDDLTDADLRDLYAYLKTLKKK